MKLEKVVISREQNLEIILQILIKSTGPDANNINECNVNYQSVFSDILWLWEAKISHFKWPEFLTVSGITFLTLIKSSKFRVLDKPMDFDPTSKGLWKKTSFRYC